MDLVPRVRRFIADRRLIARGARVLVALSGGSDSVALAHVIRELADSGELRAAGFAHFNHQLRPGAAADERFCRELASSFGWPIEVGSEDVAAAAKRDGRSVEHAARSARHAFFERARASLNGDCVALGHTLDDQAETFLLRLLRGAGPRGLGGMHARTGAIVRPLLAVRREELREYLQRCGARFVEDETNADVAIPRNRIRAELLPLLERRFNPGIVQVLADEAELAQDEWGYVQRVVEDRWAQVAFPGADSSLALDIPALSALPLALRRAIVWRAMNETAAGRPISFNDAARVLRLVESEENGGIDAPGQRVERRGQTLVLKGRPAGAKGRLAPEPPNVFDMPLSIPGEVRVPEAGCVISAEVRQAWPGPLRADTSDEAVVRGEPDTAAWRVRSRRPGDRFRPLGLDGWKKLQDYFVDRKVRRAVRDQVPLVVDAHDRIVWVAGHAIDEGFRVTDPAKGVIILRLRHLGGPA